jgi:hypothetical protein
MPKKFTIIIKLIGFFYLTWLKGQYLLEQGVIPMNSKLIKIFSQVDERRSIKD